ncbi:MAG: hypothetical protein GTO22_10690 [Gemmatimonadales bacterium]|nr:hypothetical protein [Gemmatimonadales bacterium]
MMIAATVHGGLVVALVLGAAASDQIYRSIGGPGPRGGGGGGGSVARYVELVPAMTREAAARHEEPTPPRPPVELALPQPELEPTVAELPRFEVVTGLVIPAPRLGRGTGTGGGPGAGSGRGGGAGTGQGTGVGAGRGPGTGGDGGNVFPPEPTFIIVPADRPKSVRGKQFDVHFWVDARGRVTKVEVDPAIEDAGYRKKFMEQMYQFQFTPARTLDGRPVPGRVVIPITL